MKAKKSLGQHFLVNKQIASRIVQAMPVEGYQYLAEVGPGRGALTEHFINFKDKNIILIETDDDLIPALVRAYPHFTVLHTDFLNHSLATLSGGKPMGVIGNFPYNISSQIVFKLIDEPVVVCAVGMFQKEMAERIYSKPGTKVYGIISVFAQALFDIEYLFTVSPGNFYPPPKVNSAVLKFQRKTSPHPFARHRAFIKIVKTSFNQRRKMLRNTLKTFYPETLLSQQDIFSRRPESLSLEEFYFLTQMHLDSYEP